MRRGPCRAADPNDNDTLRKFGGAVLAAEPTAIGGPVSILKSGRNRVKASSTWHHRTGRDRSFAWLAC